VPRERWGATGGRGCTCAAATSGLGRGRSGPSELVDAQLRDAVEDDSLGEHAEPQPRSRLGAQFRDAGRTTPSGSRRSLGSRPSASSGRLERGAVDAEDCGVGLGPVWRLRDRGGRRGSATTKGTYCGWENKELL
jgi:hypothetical protein